MEVEFISPDGHRAYTRNPERMREWLRGDYIPAHKAAEEAVTAALGVDWQAVWRRHRPTRTPLNARAARAFLGVKFDTFYTITRPDGRWDIFGENLSQRGREYSSVRVTTWTAEDMSKWEQFRHQYEAEEERQEAREAAETRRVLAERGRWVREIEAADDRRQEKTYTLPDGGALVVGAVVTAQRIGCLDGAAVGTLEEALAGWCRWDRHQPAATRVAALAEWLRATDIVVDIDRLAGLLAQAPGRAPGAE